MRNKSKIAFVIGCETSDLDQYQRERGVYQNGSHYFQVLPPGRAPKDDGKAWKQVESSWNGCDYVRASIVWYAE